MEERPTPASPAASWRARLPVGILRPLGIRDFALLWTGLAVSLFGDGIYLVAIAWQVYSLSDAPSALAIVGVAWTAPQVALLLASGVVSDRFDRRRIMIAADLIRGVAILAVGLLSVTGALELWHIVVLVVVYGAGEALFLPAFGSIVPSIVPDELLVQANSLDRFVRPVALHLAGAGLGGWLIATFGTGEAFLVDAATFGVSALALSAMRFRAPARELGVLRSRLLGEIREGLAFARSHRWVWLTLASTPFTLLALYGPWQVLVPFIVKNELGGSARDLGLVFAAEGVGTVLASITMGQIRLPRRPITFMYLAWTLAVATPIVYGLATSLWHIAAAAIVAGAGATSGTVVWITLLQRFVPPALLGRMMSLDSFVLTSLTPLSFALTAPLAALVGVEATLIGSGAIAAAIVFAVLFVPGMRDVERSGRFARPPALRDEPSAGG